LHVGCGDGSWCTDIAKLFPNWLVVGIDDKSGGPSPDQRKVPKNFKYIRCFYDILKTLKDIPADSFDFVYARFLLDAYGDDCYQDLAQECHRICKPKGYVELYELDMRIYGNPKAGPITHKLNTKGKYTHLINYISTYIKYIVNVSISVPNYGNTQFKPTFS
jgi:ubiquinone/menaquinone biosynthesis C-methylase UbiE